MDLNKLTIGEFFELKKMFDAGIVKGIEKREINHGCCIVVLDKGFMYIGELTTDGEFLVIKNPKNIRQYTSGKGLLWHAKNGSKNMILDAYQYGILKAPYAELKHFIPTDAELWA